MSMYEDYYYYINYIIKIIIIYIQVYHSQIMLNMFTT